MVSDIPAGDGKMANYFLQCGCVFDVDIFFGGDGAGWGGRVNNCKNQVLLHGALCAHLYSAPFYYFAGALSEKTIAGFLFHGIKRHLSALSAGGAEKKTIGERWDDS